MASWCCGENTGRQLHLASLPLLARGVSVLGSQFEANAKALQRTISEKEIVSHSLQEEIFSLRSQLQSTRDSESRLLEVEAEHKTRIQDLSDELKEVRNTHSRTCLILTGRKQALKVCACFLKIVKKHWPQRSRIRKDAK